MREITNKTELAEFFRDELLPYYEKHYREDLTHYSADRLHLGSGLCDCARMKFKVGIYIIMEVECGIDDYLFPQIIWRGDSAKESLLPRIEWMKQFIKDNLPCE